MKINITEAAIKELLERCPSLEDDFLFIKYDTEGCGCVVSGVTRLTHKNQLDPLDNLAITTDNIKVAFEKQYEWVYDEDMVIDYLAGYNAFQLKSNSQILNSRMLFQA